MDMFKNARAKLQNLQQQIEEINNTELSSSELFTEEFMLANSRYMTFEELLTAGGFEAENKEEFEKIPEKELDQHIENSTSFSSLHEMKQSAVQTYAANKLKIK